MPDPASKPGKSPEKIDTRRAPGQPGGPRNRGTPRDYGLRIARDGTWYHQGSPIQRKPLVKLFSTVLRREDDGSFWLVTPAERGPIVVDDAPFTAVELCVTGSGRDQELHFRTNLDDWVIAGPDHPIRVETRPDTGEPSPYILIRDRLEALILRPVFYELVERAETKKQDGKDILGLWSRNTFFLMGALPQAD